MQRKLARRHLLAGLVASPLLASELLIERATASESVSVLNSSLVLTSPDTLNLTADTTYTITNHTGQVITQGTTTTKAIAVNLPDGFYRLQLPAGEVPFIVATRSLSRNSFWGVCANFTNTSIASAGTHKPEQLVPDLARIGVCSIRETFLWEQVEPKTALGSYTQLSEYEARAGLLEKYGMELFYVASNTHSSFGPWRNMDQPSTRDQYARHIVQVLAANPKVRSVEIWNEFNGGFNTGNKSGENYASLLAHVYPIIKKAHPDVEVVAGGTAGEAFDFARAFFTAGGGNFMDTWSFHPYSVSGRGIYDAAEVYRRYMRENGAAEKPCRVTEMGWAITDPANTAGNNAKVHSEHDQAVNLLNAYAGAFIHPAITAGHWYNALTTRDATVRAGFDVEATEGSFGLFTLPLALAPNAYAPRMAAYAFYALRCALEDVSASAAFRADAQYKYPIFGAGLSDGRALVSTSGWLSGAVDETVFTKQVAVSVLQPAAAGSMYWKSQPILGAPAYGYGTKAPSNREPAIITLSPTAFGEGETYPVHGGIGAYWRSRGGEAFFGPAISAEEPIAGGWMQRFAKNRIIYWHSATGAREVWTSSLIGRRYLEDGGPLTYGFPTTSESKVAGHAGAWSQDFLIPGGANFTISRTSTATRAYVVDHSTYLGQYWAAHRSWGLPVQDAVSVASGLGQELISAQGRRNLMAWSPRTGTAVLYLDGAIGARWRASGGLTGWGFPKYSEQVAYRTGGYHQSFVNLTSGYESYAYWTAATGTAVMDGRGVIYRGWVRAGAESSWGHPVSDQKVVGAGMVVVDFSKVRVTYNPRTGLVSTTSR